MIIRDQNPADRAGPSPQATGPDRTHRSAAANSADPTASSRTSSAEADHDNISLSNLSVRLRELASSDTSGKQVERISKEYANGSYSPNALNISRGLIRDAAYGF